MRRGWLLLGAVLAAPLFLPGAEAGDPPGKVRRIVLIGMDRDSSPGQHEYLAGLAVLAGCLKQTPGVMVTVVNASKAGKGLPGDARVLEEANAVVLYLRGGGGYLLQDKERRAAFETLLKKGAGLVALHGAVEGPKALGQPLLALLGGCYEPGFSRNPLREKTEVKPAGDGHPVARGWKAFAVRDEFFANLRLLPEAKAVAVADLSDAAGGKDEPVAWAYERKDSQGPLGPGRSFACTGGHYYSTFGAEGFRRLLVNGILWAAGAEVPEGGAPVALDALPKPPEGR